MTVDLLVALSVGPLAVQKVARWVAQLVVLTDGTRGDLLVVPLADLWAVQ